MASKRRRPQAPKVRNEAMYQGMVEIRKGSRAQPHRNLSKYSRSDYRKVTQRGEY